MTIQTTHSSHIRRTKVRQFPVYNPRLKYYYIIAVVKGKRFIASVPGEFRNINQARIRAGELVRKSDDLHGVRWDVIESKYSDINHVMSILRHPIWEQTGSIEEAVQRMRHKF